jgi:3',5'-cyclic-AMP phosphodiesterase
MLCAQVTDPHLDGTGTTRDRLRRVVAELARSIETIDLILVTGDAVQSAAFANAPADAILAEYRLAHEMLSPIAPVGYCPGNADDATFDTFIAELGIDKVNHRVDASGVTFLMLDSRILGELPGHLDDTTLAWLEASLEAEAGPVVIALHHPPIAYGQPVIDTLKLDNADALEAVVRRYPQVVGLLCGHTHTAIAARFADRPIFVAPGVHSSGRLPWIPQEPGTPPIDPTAPPAYAMHRIDGEGMTSLPVVLRQEEG